ncbi:MAG: alpha/beta fold hydrolase [Deltaproteobacteria bacterium]|nr:alpha/beta fold hydrolase [Deltaproteobacteria bacterium]MCW5801582.1 alpha/beta fold hydrolase [Deltaproteobacteria bacterium]
MMPPPKKGPIDSLLALVRRAPKGPPPVGETPHDVVWTENKWRLLHFSSSGRRYRRPILLVPSLINRWYVLDLGPGRSLIEWLVARGHDVYCIDWGTPGDEDRYLTWDDICGRYLGRAVRLVARRSDSDVHVLGYCLGGTIAAAYVAAFPDDVASLLALAAPVDFAHAGIMSTWTRTPTFDVGAILDAFGNIPWPLMQASFRMLRPTLNAAKVVGLLDRAWDDEFLDGFLATERWGNDNVSFPGACYQRYIDELYRQNRLVAGTFSVLGRPARLPAIECPTLAVAFADDNIVPAAAAGPLVELVSSRDKQVVIDRGGHVGAVVSRKAADRLWPALHTFWAQRD